MSKVPAVAIREMKAALATISEFTKVVTPENMAKAKSMLAIIGMVADGAIEKLEPGYNGGH